jgi:hypothetical protein
MKTMRNAGEPLSGGRVDRRAADARAFRGTLLMVGLFTGVVLVNGVLALVLIEVLQALGWWPEPASEGAGDAARDVSTRLRARTAPAA